MENTKKTLSLAFFNAIGAAIYVGLVATFMSNAESIGEIKGVFPPITFLLVFVLSAAVMGTLLFGRPLLWYFDGKKKEAVKLLLYTVSIFAIITLAMILLLFLQNS